MEKRVRPMQKMQAKSGDVATPGDKSAYQDWRKGKVSDLDYLGQGAQTGSEQASPVSASQGLVNAEFILKKECQRVKKVG